MHTDRQNKAIKREQKDKNDMPLPMHVRSDEMRSTDQPQSRCTFFFVIRFPADRCHSINETFHYIIATSNGDRKLISRALDPVRNLICGSRPNERNQNMRQLEQWQMGIRFMALWHRSNRQTICGWMFLFLDVFFLCSFIVHFHFFLLLILFWCSNGLRFSFCIGIHRTALTGKAQNTHHRITCAVPADHNVGNSMHMFERSMVCSRRCTSTRIDDSK